MVKDTILQPETRPTIIYTEYGVTYRWKVTTVWKASEGLPIKEVELSAFEYELQGDRWFKTYIEPTVQNILRHFIRVQGADLSFPIILAPNGRVLDGMHRICKALLIGKTTISTVQLKELPASDKID